MFDKNFYPTPPEVIEKVLKPYHKTIEDKTGDIRFSGYDLSGKTMLEPSAGSGAFIEHIMKNTNRYNKPKIHAIEKNPELQSILKDKECTIVGDDFLNFSTFYNYDIIIMNPPFDQGAKHLLKAWDILESGNIDCLLNAETYFNPFSKERKLLRAIIDANGTVEELGAAFKTAERKTNVEVVLVRLSKKKEAKKGYSFANLDDEMLDFPEDVENNKVAVQDVLKSYEDRYKATILAYKEMTEAINKFKYFEGGIFGGAREYIEKFDSQSYNEFVSQFNSSAWNKVLNESKFQNYLTSRVRKDFSQKFSSQSNFAFTKPNMLEMFNVLWDNKDSILDECILEAFEEMTQYHEYNRVHIEGWKTNDAYKVNQKVIFPNKVKYGQYMSSYDIKQFGDTFGVNYTSREQLCDIDRALCHLTGTKFEYLYELGATIYQALDNKFSVLGKVYPGDKYDNTTESYFFNIKFFKKGTIHITFKDSMLWEVFNRKASALRGFPLPEPKKQQEKKREKPVVDLSDIVIPSYEECMQGVLF